ncbi:unnamed protein product [Prunus brigantina]
MASSTSAFVEARSQVFQTEFEDICREIQGSVLSNIVMPWTDDDGATTDSCVLGPSVKGGMPERLVAHLKNNLVDLSAFDGGGGGGGTSRIGTSLGRSPNGQPRPRIGKNGCRGWSISSASNGKIKASTT